MLDQITLAPPGGIRLVSSDLDGTMLVANREITPRTRSAIAECRRAGITIMPNTGRQHTKLADLLAPAGIDGVAVVNNGALGVDLRTGELLFEELISPDVQRGLAERLTQELPDVRFWALRSGARHSILQVGYRELMDSLEVDHGGPIGEIAALSTVVSRPAVKLIVRHPGIGPHQLLAAINGLGLDSFHATTSGAPLVEVQAKGVTKATGLARMAEHLGVTAAQTVAVGDELNDLEMLQWSGYGVAMGNALASIKDAADAVTASNRDDGLALLLEAVLRARG